MSPLLLALLVQALSPAGESPAADRAAAVRIAALINDYRAANGLPPIPISRSMTAVAEAHAKDMAVGSATGRPFDHGRDERGLPCNAHSWSNRGPWTPVCYTADHRYARFMWNKPREITQGAYPGNGYEIGYETSGLVIPEQAVRGWQTSEHHNRVILELERWQPMDWQAMGVGVSGRFAFVWFGQEADPAR